MAGKTSLIAVRDRGWLNGFVPLWRKENRGLWGTWSWLVQILIWTAIIDGLLAIVALSDAEGSLMIYFIVASILPASAAIIFGHETIIDERKLGTAAWVLSKPASRAAFLLAKFSADALGVLVIRVLLQGLIAYFIYGVATGIWLSIPGFLAGLGMIYLFLIFFLALTLMLGVLFHSRGPVIGIALAFISSSYLTVLVPWLGKFMPMSMFMSIEESQPSLAEALALGQPITTVAPIISTVLLVTLFIFIAVVRFQREEF